MAVTHFPRSSVALRSELCVECAGLGCSRQHFLTLRCCAHSSSRKARFFSSWLMSETESRNRCLEFTHHVEASLLFRYEEEQHLCMGPKVSSRPVTGEGDKPCFLGPRGCFLAVQVLTDFFFFLLLALDPRASWKDSSSGNHFQGSSRASEIAWR